MSRAQFMNDAGRKPGYNVDALDLGAGLRELVAAGYPDTEQERHYVIAYALQRWARGEEEAAERGAIDQSFRGVPLTVWRRVLAAAMASGEAARVAALDAPQHPNAGSM